MELGLRGQVALVTGGGTGIGAGISEALAQEGVSVAVNWVVGKEDVEKRAAELSRSYGTDCRAFYADISRPDDLDAMVKEIVAVYGHIDILVNNAGIWPTENILDMPDGNWAKGDRHQPERDFHAVQAGGPAHGGEGDPREHHQPLFQVGVPVQHGRPRPLRHRQGGGQHDDQDPAARAGTRTASG